MNIEKGQLNTKELDAIYLTENEIKHIQNLRNEKNFNVRAMTFLVLFLAKAGKTQNTALYNLPVDGYYISEKNYSDYVEMLDTEEKRKGIDFHILESQYITAKESLFYSIESFCRNYNKSFEYDYEKKYLKVNFAEDSKDGVPVTYENALDIFRYVIEGEDNPLKACVVCGNLFKKNNNKQKYCKSCLKDVRRIQVNEAVKRLRAKA